MVKYMHYSLANLMLWLVLCFAISSCTTSNTGELVGERFVTLKVVLPDNQDQEPPLVEVRSGVSEPGIPAESAISILKFFVYKNNGAALERYEQVEINSDGTSSNPMWDAANQSLRLVLTPGNKQIYCIANWAVMSSAEMPLIDDTNATNATILKGKTRIHNGVTPTNPPVMTGELSKKLTGDEESLKIELKRQIARVELTFKLSEELAAINLANIKIEGVRFLNLAKTAHVFPQSSILQVASNATWNQAGYAGTSMSVAAPVATYPTLYYIPEYAPYSLQASRATTMVIKANYHGQTVYYSVALDPGASTNFPNHPKYTIERNHTYRCNITIQGIGDTSEPVITRSGIATSTGITYELEIK